MDLAHDDLETLLRMLSGLGLQIVSVDRGAGTVVVRVPMLCDTEEHK